MKLPELAETLRERLLELDHPEIVDVELRLKPENVGKPGFDHPLLRVKFASGATANVLAYAVRGPGIPKHEPYALPREVY
jgi:hypothetical protein